MDQEKVTKKKLTRKKLTRKQQALLNVLILESDEQGVCRFTHLAVATFLGFSKNGLRKMLNKLVDLEYIEYLEKPTRHSFGSIKVISPK